MVLVEKASKNVIHDEWLSKILGKDVYKVTIDEEFIRSAQGNGENGRLKKSSAIPVFLYAKVPTDYLAAVRFLEESGFNLIDTNVIFDKRIVSVTMSENNRTLRFAIPKDENHVADLAGENFTYSRFHLDKSIPAEVANKIKQEWARNYFNGKRGDQMVVALMEGRVVGFLQLLRGNNGVLTIDLMAVDRNYRRKGIAGDMIAFAEAQCRGFSRIVVGTQLANIPSIRLYERNGFRVCASQYVFHYHHFPTEIK